MTVGYKGTSNGQKGVFFYMAGIERRDIRRKFETDVYPATISIQNRNHTIDVEHAIIRDHIQRVYDGGTLLDIGGNWGVVLSGFPPQELDEAVVIDIAREPLRIGNSSIPGIQYVQADGSRIPFDDDVADLIVCSSTIQYIDDDQAFLREVSRLLKPGGSLVLGAPSKNYLKNSAYSYLMWRSPDPIFAFQDGADLADRLRGYIHHTGYTRGELTERLATAGLEIEKTDHILHRSLGQSLSFNQVRFVNKMLGPQPVNRLLGGTVVLTATLNG